MIVIVTHKYSDGVVLVDTGYRSSGVQLIDRAVPVGRITLDNLVIVHDMFIKSATNIIIKGVLLLPKASWMCFFQLLLFSLFCCIAIIPVYCFIRSITVLTSTTKSHSFTIFELLQICFTKITDNILYTCRNRWLDYRKSIMQLLHWGISQLNPVHSCDIIFITLVPGFNYTINNLKEWHTAELRWLLCHLCMCHSWRLFIHWSILAMHILDAIVKNLILSVKIKHSNTSQISNHSLHPIV